MTVGKACVASHTRHPVTCLVPRHMVTRGGVDVPGALIVATHQIVYHESCKFG